MIFNMNKKRIMGFEVGGWLKMGEDDFSSAAVNFDNGKYYVCSYLCHQCVEKALKALMIKKNKEFVKTHDLVYLAEKVGLPKELIGSCDKLSLVFIETKYGTIAGGIPSEIFSKRDSEKHLKYADEVLGWIKKNI